jgi:hypothetical protein
MARAQLHRPADAQLGGASGHRGDVRRHVHCRGCAVVGAILREEDGWGG